MDVNAIGSFMGGVGLFLLGMRLMTDGLKLAAGPALRHILGQWTRTPLRGLFSGIFITSLVQSSSAVTVATIGFVNAGLLTLAQSVGVIYGSNIGTTMTGWLVALVGFNVNIKALALPLIGIGVGLRFTGAHSRRGALGEALTGFGLFFIGVDVLKGAFEGVGGALPLEEMANSGWLGSLLFVGIGFMLTLLMQSSSAAMAVILTATAGGLVPLATAAAAVIGANVGTTSTAALSVIGATPNAKRVAAAHVLFNLLAGMVAILILPFMLQLTALAGTWAGLESTPAVVLALFHTVFNLLGVLLMWPLTSGMVHFLEGRFRTMEEDLSRPQYLDKNVVATPTLALDALALELARIGGIARGMAKGVLSAERNASQQLAVDRQAVVSLVEAVGQFSVVVQRAHLPAELDESLPNALRVARYYSEVAESGWEANEVQSRASFVQDEPLTSEMTYFRSDAVKLLDMADPQREDYDHEAVRRLLAAQEDAYQSLKGHLLRAGAEGRIRSEQMVDQLELFSDIRRLLQQTVKGAGYLHGLLDLAARYRRMQQEDRQAEQ